MPKVVIVGLLFLFLIPTCTAAIECEVLQNPSAFDQRHVALEGALVWSREGISLYFPHCSQVLTTGTYIWKKELWVRGSGSDTIGLKARLGALLKALEPELIAQQVNVTVRVNVVIRSHPKYYVLPGTGGRQIPNGFGHLKQYVAEAILSDVSMIQIKEREPVSQGASTAPR